MGISGVGEILNLVVDIRCIPLFASAEGGKYYSVISGIQRISNLVVI